MLHIARLPCPGGGMGSIYAYYCQYTNCSTTWLGSYASTMPEQGRGGAGGEGAGWGFRVSVGGGKQPATQGQGGKANVPAKCSGGESPTGASNSTPGGAGGDGGDIVTMPVGVFEKCYNHILTDKGLELFNNDWKSVQALNNANPSLV